MATTPTPSGDTSQPEEIISRIEPAPIRGDLGDLKILPNEVLFMIASRCDHKTFINFASVSSRCRAFCFKRLFRSIQLRGTQGHMSKDLSILINKGKMPWDNYSLTKSASILFNEVIYSYPSGDTQLKEVDFKVPSKIAQGLAVLKNLSDLTLDVRALNEMQVREFITHFLKGPKLNVKHLALFDVWYELNDVMTHCEPLESLHLYTAWLEYPFDLGHAFPTPARYHPQLKKLCVTVNTNDMPSLGAEMVTFIANHFADLECLVLNSPHCPDAAGYQRFPTFEECFEDFVKALQRMKHLKYFALSVSDGRIWSLSHRLDRLEVTDEYQDCHAAVSSHPTDVEDHHSGIANASPEANGEFGHNNHRIIVINTDGERVSLAEFERDLATRVYAQLVHHLGDVLPNLEEICILRGHPNICRGTRIKGSQKLDVRGETNEDQSLRFPTGAAHPFLLTPTRLETKYVGMATKGGCGASRNT